jgi:hypothetical protein
MGPLRNPPLKTFINGEKNPVSIRTSITSTVSLNCFEKSGAERTGLLIRIDWILQNESSQSFI